MPRLHGQDAIAWAESHGRKTVGKYGDPVEGPLSRCPLEKARNVAREDPGLIYLDCPDTITSARAAQAAQENPLLREADISKMIPDYANPLPRRAWIKRFLEALPQDRRGDFSDLK